jgi:hypothetical protein
MSTKADSIADDNRIDPRFPAAAVPEITSVRLSPGDTVELVNLSRSGVLVEGRTRFVPGTRVTIIFEGTFTPAQVKGKVVRCQVSSINGGSLRYQSGIQFEKRLDLSPAGEPATPTHAAATVVQHPAAVPAAAPPRLLVNRW